MLSLYDPENQMLTLCCSMCGAAETFDLSPLDADTEVALSLEHVESCFVGVEKDTRS